MNHENAPGKCTDCGNDAYIQMADDDAFVCAHCFAGHHTARRHPATMDPIAMDPIARDQMAVAPRTAPTAKRAG